MSYRDEKHFMTFDKAYNYLLSLSNLPRKEYLNESRKCGIYLKRFQLFLDLLGNPEKQIPHYIHVTGTSGKGSVVAILHSILKAEGKVVGSTYSPHLKSITDRFKIDGRNMSKKEFVDLVRHIKPKLDQYARTCPYEMISFFEITEAIALLWFAQKKVEWAILEAGCGGRHDSSNIIPKKDIAIITNIGLDHVGLIGNNKLEIAYEKAGIIKKDALAFTMEKNKIVRSIIEKEVKKNKTKLKYIKHSANNIMKNIDGISFEYNCEKYWLPTLGEHQIKNAELCIEVAQSLGISTKTIRAGLKKLALPARMQIIMKRPLTIVDTAHNIDKIKTTVKTMNDIRELNKKNVILLVGFSNNKKISALTKELSKLKPKIVICTRNTVNPFRKVADPKKIAGYFKKYSPKTKVEIFIDPSEALKFANKKIKKQEILLITGSVFLAGELLQHI